MKYSYQFDAEFDASHEYTGGHCSGLHGHGWSIAIRFSTEPSDLEGRTQAERLFAGLVSEIDGRHLNTQLPVSAPTPMGIAAWAFERLDMLIPGLIWARVDLGTDGALIERS